MLKSDIAAECWQYAVKPHNLGYSIVKMLIYTIESVKRENDRTINENVMESI